MEKMQEKIKQMNFTAEREIIYSEEKLKEKLTKLGLLQQIGNHNISRLCQGLPTTLVENIHHEGRVHDGKFMLQVDQNGNYNLNFNKKKKELEMPEEVLGIKLSSKDKELLLNGETLGPFTHSQSKTNFFLIVDKELNSISIKTEKQLGIPTEMLGHKFTDEEKTQLSNNKPVGPKVFKVENHYFIGTFIMHQHESQHHMSMLIDKEISKEQAAILTEQYKNNKDISKPLEKQNDGLFIPIQETPKVLDNLNSETQTLKALNSTSPSKEFTLAPKPLKPSQSFMVEKNGFVFQYNETFGFQTVTYHKEYGLMNKIYGYKLTNEDIKALKEGKPLLNRKFILKNSQSFTGHIYLNQTADKYQFVVEPVSQLKDNKLLPQHQKFTDMDRQVMDLVDKKNFKELNQMVKQGYKPSENVQTLIFKNDKISIQEKQEIATLFNVDEKKVSNLHYKEETNTKTKKKGVPGSSKIPTSKDIKDKDKSNHNNRDKLLNATKGLFSDM